MINIAIDGPSGAGKSTIARKVAEKLGFVYVDTGAMYRAIGVHVMRHNLPTDDARAVISVLYDAHIALAYQAGEQHILLNGEDVSKAIRLPEASMAASNVSAIPEVRAYLFDLQKNIANTTNCIMDGRDIGTVVLPDAQVKIFLTATAEERTRRRCLELEQKGTPVDYDTLLTEIIQRDYNDSHRAAAPLKKADDATEIDSTGLSIEEITDIIVKMAEAVL
ncbi:MAG: (d)CMP kinase [Ruminococcaceae bacterium]|nr:(d)CMP kinase [Oscillospiraceae bacterium]